MNATIPVYRPSLPGREREYVLQCLDSNWISSKGSFIDKFEKRFASYVGARHATSVCNGTTALHVALSAIGLQPGDEVIVPTLTYVASVNAIRYCGATPIFVDSDPSTWQMSTVDVRAKLSPRTKAILAVHLYGQSCDLGELDQIARSRKLYLVEDCAEALGTRYRDQHVGSTSDISTFSFFGNKTITTGEGGMVVTNDTLLYDRCVQLKGQGLARGREYWHDSIGYNYRMTNICAAIGLAQMESIDQFLAKKREIAESYRTTMKDLPISFHNEAEGTTHSHWMVTFLLDSAGARDELRFFLAERGIETRPTFNPVHLMPMYSNTALSYPIAERIGESGVNLPSFPDLTLDELRYVADAIRLFFSS